MNLKKNLKTPKAQSVVEYILVFTVIAAGVIVVFHGFSLEGTQRINMINIFQEAINRAVNFINQGW